MKGYMYILECSNGRFYVGSTNNLERRISEHQNGHGYNYTKERLPVELIYYEEFNRIDEAFKREQQIKGWSRVKKIALIENNHSQLPRLSKSKSKKRK